MNFMVWLPGTFGDTEPCGGLTVFIDLRTESGSRCRRPRDLFRLPPLVPFPCPAILSLCCRTLILQILSYLCGKGLSIQGAEAGITESGMNS